MRFLITAGPTREFLDPVRFLSNRSSGKMGYAVAESAWGRGHSVTLVSGPVAIPALSGITMINVVSAQEMLHAVLGHIPKCDVLVMCAAVADWRPKTMATSKLKKRSLLNSSQKGCFNLELEPTPDILLTVQPLKEKRIFVGFAAETDDVIVEAHEKLERKGLDLIVANDIRQPDAGFEVDTNRVTFLEPRKSPDTLPLMPKTAVADRIIEWCEKKRSANRG